MNDASGQGDQGSIPNSNPPAKRKRLVDTQFLKTVANEILSDPAAARRSEAAAESEEEAALALIAGGEMPPPAPNEEEPPPWPGEGDPPPLPADHFAAEPPPPPPSTTGEVDLPPLPPFEAPPPKDAREEVRRKLGATDVSHLVHHMKPAIPAESPPPSPEAAGAPPAVPPTSSTGSLPGSPPVASAVAPQPPAEEKKALFKKKLPIGEILVRHGVINRTQLDYALKFQEENARDQKLGEILFRLKIVSNDNYGILVNALMAQFQADEVNLDELGQFVDLSLSERFKLTRLEKEAFLPLRIVEDRGSRTLEVFIESENDLQKIDELRAIFNVSKVRSVGAFDRTSLKALISEIQKGKAMEIQPETAVNNITVLSAPDEDSIASDAIKRSREDNYITKVTDKIIYDGVKLGASDIHVEFGEVPRVRYRVDGILQEGGWISNEDYPAVISRLKILSELDISERRVPQDGNIRLGIEGFGVLDFRVNTIPVSGGEKVCLRILDGTKLHSLTLDQIGLPEPILESYLEMINRPQGMVLITGPTGSGKSTTLYSSLIYILDTRGKETNICTAEDPIEYRLEGLNQTQLNEKVGLTFPKILKAFLRQDPDICLVGEIRDLETAELAIKASQTGHMVLSTLHTNTAINTVARMVNMGVPNYLVADSILCVMNQRLARRICKNCAAPYTPSEKDRALVPKEWRDDFQFIKGRGCPKCGYKGYKGRVGFYEYLRLSRGLKRLILNKASEEELLLLAHEEGFITLREYALQKAREGFTTLDEVVHHTVDQFEQ